VILERADYRRRLIREYGPTLRLPETPSLHHTGGAIPRALHVTL
jgi:hypothetical protein